MPPKTIGFLRLGNKKGAMTISPIRLEMRSAPPPNPRPELSAKKSPRAVPNVFEKRMVVQ